MTMLCTQCGKATGTINQTFTCEPGGEPIEAWLHRECEAAFLQYLDEQKAQIAPQAKAVRS
jgi:hypothetical protein